MEGNTQKDEKEKVGTCPCYTTPKEAAWNEEQWKKHWADRRKGHKIVLEQLHKEARR